MPRQPYVPTKKSSSSDWFVAIRTDGTRLSDHFQEREIEKVNVFYLQKEAEVGSKFFSLTIHSICGSSHSDLRRSSTRNESSKHD